MKQFKKLIACVLAATLMLGSSTLAFASEVNEPTQGTIGGTGKVEDVVNREVFSVVTPTVGTTSNAYDFTLDPEGLIEETNGKKASADGYTFVTYGSMYFKVSDTAYDVKSQEATLTNKSSVDVTVSLNAKVTVPTSNSAVKFVESADFGTSTDLEIYLAIEGKTETGAEVTGAAIATVVENTYTAKTGTDLVSYNAYTLDVSGGNYVYAIDPVKEAQVSAAAYTFWLTGACNTNADWSTYVEDAAAQPTIELIWSVDVKNGEGNGQTGQTAPTTPSVSALKIANKGSVVVTLPENVTIKDVQRVASDGTTYKSMKAENLYELSEKVGYKQTLTLKDVLKTYTTCTSIKIIFDGADPITLELTAK